MTGVNTGSNGCLREQVATGAIDRMLEIGSKSDVADTRAAVLASMSECGRLCRARGICLANNSSSDRETEIITTYTELFEAASNVGMDCGVVID